MANGLFNLKQVVQAVQQGGWPAQKTPAVEYLVVAGGGGGGNGGGGGAGGLLAGVRSVANGQSLLVTVGSGGNGSTTAAAGVTGGNSVFGNILANGGGGGSGYQTAGAAGGSGGGGGRSDVAGGLGGSGISGQGNSGGKGLDTSNNASGGGGGAGTIGRPALFSGYSGIGGTGTASAISGTVTTYAGGGAGYGATSGAVQAGAGGGGSGAAGTANTGGGGGGSGSGTGYNGGSGIVIISYPDVYAAPTATTGSPTVSTSGSGSVNFATAGYFSTGTGTAPSQSGDFTLEGWFNLSTFNPGGGGYALFGGTTSGANYFGIKGTNIVINSATTSAEKLIACTLPSTNTWFHYCLMRSGSTLYAFLNGVLQGSSTWTDVLFSAGSLLVGGYGSATYICPGYMSNLRLTNTAVYSTSGFTVPTSPLTRVTGTALLMNTVSGAYAADSTGTWSFLNLYTAPTWNALSPFTGTGYKNRVYTWTSSGSITF
jgi:hypothetical protein